MRKEMFLLCFGALALWSLGTARAQQTGHPMPSGSSAGGGAGVCGENSRQGLQVIEAANRRLEESRQSNNPTKIRAAMDELQGALGQLKTHLSLCAAAVSSEPMDMGMQGMDHSKMGQSKMDPKMDHSKMGQEKPAGPKSEKPPSAEMDHSKRGQSKMDPKMDHSKMGQEKPPAPKSEKPPSAEMDHSKMGQSKMDPKMDHSKMGQEKPAEPKSEKKPPAEMDHNRMGQEKPAAPSAAQAKDPVDPVCGMEVGTQAAEKATYQGKTYYFCSRADREKFLSDPANYVKR